MPVRRRVQPATALAVSFTLMVALVLAGCSDPAGSTAGTPIGTSAAPEGSGTTTPDPTDPGNTGLDQEAAASIESTVSEAESLLAELDQEFQQDAAEAG
jgi:hypothetical protein